MRRSSVIPAILVTSYEDTNKVLGTFAQQTLGCQQMQCFRAAATTARDAMAAIINRQHAAFGSYDGEHYTVFVYETALSYLKGDFAELAETYDQPSFTNIIQNTVEPHSAQFRSSGAQLLTAFGAEAVSGSSVD
jgi:hypothetical protein